MDAIYYLMYTVYKCTCVRCNAFWLIHQYKPCLPRASRPGKVLTSMSLLDEAALRHTK